MDSNKSFLIRTVISRILVKYFSVIESRHTTKSHYPELDHCTQLQSGEKMICKALL